MSTRPPPARAPETLARRYRPEHLAVFTPAERRRFLGPLPLEDLEVVAHDEDAWLRVASMIGWELLYRIEPELYERIIAGERLHPEILEWFPERIERAVEVAAGSGRLTLPLAERCEQLVAVEPAEPLRRMLEEKLSASGYEHVEVCHGFFDELPLSDGWADLVCACSALTPDPEHGGDVGLNELERVCAPGGLVVIVWPAGVDWLASHGYTYVSFPGAMEVEFAGAAEAVELARIFYPHAADEVEARGSAHVPYDVLGMNPPRDLCWKRITE